MNVSIHSHMSNDMKVRGYKDKDSGTCWIYFIQPDGNDLTVYFNEVADLEAFGIKIANAINSVLK